MPSGLETHTKLVRPSFTTPIQSCSPTFGVPKCCMLVRLARQFLNQIPMLQPPLESRICIQFTVFSVHRCFTMDSSSLTTEPCQEADPHMGGRVHDHAQLQVHKTQEFDDFANQLLCRSWTGLIMMKMDHGGTGSLETVDLCQFMSRRKRVHNTKVTKSLAASQGVASFKTYDRLYFDTSANPHPHNLTKSLPAKDPTFCKLKLDIMAASLESGSPVRANGSVKATDAKCFICSLCSTLHRPPKVKHKEGDHRKDSFVNSEKGGRRKNRQSGPRRTKTVKALDHDSTCKFGFNVKCNDIGFCLDEANGKHPCYFPPS